MVQIGDLLAQITGEPSPTAGSFPQSPKPKPDEGARRLSDKPKPLTTQPANPSPDPRKLSVGYPKPKVNPNDSSRASATTFKNGQPTPPPSNDVPKRPPKKGSYAEIMARGQAAQKVLGQVGKIQHKKIEKLPSKREREEMKLQRAGKIQKGMDPKSKFQKIGQSSVQGGKAGTTKGAKAGEVVPEKKVKKSALATTGYAGTARPKPGGPGRSGSTPGSSSRRPDRYDDRGGSRSRRSTYSDDEEDDVEEEDEMDYASDVSSDMEAAAFEVDEEEAKAEKIARREDAEALAEENRLKREKEEKKRRLMAMAKKAKPMSY